MTSRLFSFCLFTLLSGPPTTSSFGKSLGILYLSFIFSCKPLKLYELYMRKQSLTKVKTLHTLILPESRETRKWTQIHPLPWLVSPVGLTRWHWTNQNLPRKEMKACSYSFLQVPPSSQSLEAGTSKDSSSSVDHSSTHSFSTYLRNALLCRSCGHNYSNRPGLHSSPLWLCILRTLSKEKHNDQRRPFQSCASTFHLVLDIWSWKQGYIPTFVESRLISY
jgi:hypothetical protein